MINLLGINISDRTLDFFEQITYFNDFTSIQRQKLIINTFNSLRLDNNMKKNIRI